MAGKTKAFARVSDRRRQTVDEVSDGRAFVRAEPWSKDDDRDPLVDAIPPARGVYSHGDRAAELEMLIGAQRAGESPDRFRRAASEVDRPGTDRYEQREAGGDFHKVPARYQIPRGLADRAALARHHRLVEYGTGPIALGNVDAVTAGGQRGLRLRPEWDPAEPGGLSGTTGGIPTGRGVHDLILRSGGSRPPPLPEAIQDLILRSGGSRPPPGPEAIQLLAGGPQATARAPAMPPGAPQAAPGPLPGSQGPPGPPMGPGGPQSTMERPVGGPPTLPVELPQYRARIASRGEDPIAPFGLGRPMPGREQALRMTPGGGGMPGRTFNAGPTTVNVKQTRGEPNSAELMMVREEIRRRMLGGMNLPPHVKMRAAAQLLDQGITTAQYGEQFKAEQEKQNSAAMDSVIKIAREYAKERDPNTGEPKGIAYGIDEATKFIQMTNPKLAAKMGRAGRGGVEGFMKGVGQAIGEPGLSPKESVDERELGLRTRGLDLNEKEYEEKYTQDRLGPALAGGMKTDALAQAGYGPQWEAHLAPYLYELRALAPDLRAGGPLSPKAAESAQRRLMSTLPKDPTTRLLALLAIESQDANAILEAAKGFDFQKAIVGADRDAETVLATGGAGTFLPDIVQGIRNLQMQADARGDKDGRIKFGRALLEIESKFPPRTGGKSGFIESIMGAPGRIADWMRSEAKSEQLKRSLRPGH